METWQFRFFLISVVTLSISWLAPTTIDRILSWKTEVDPFLARFKDESITDSLSEFSSLFVRSAEYGLPIAFTLSSGKVYIGYLPYINFGEVNDIELIPLVSGYRKDKTKKLVYTTNYHAVVDDLSNMSGNTESLDKFLIALPIREIVHANLHDFSFRDTFDKHEIT
ncbi:hypothetical protein QWI17_15730 [Gilvimarinus sp. SDUM040013]|uniref:Uncharacterized protein n=1 Tax=Gilvimarinus gilvus TaxID=3058038 RepID=A0ABU4RVT5_9GAMM|nr:hypothetical protein [Gilvimarinus sp. SDUM040013]MDO3387291.1 hypothetical protein [Gilvimarinus sp. SDUM040013]MDX6848980.1 hypothetical protein [Gilvimarinus sp. SDUM040013]